MLGWGTSRTPAEIQDEERMQSDVSERKRQAGTGQGPGVSFPGAPPPRPHAPSAS